MKILYLHGWHSTPGGVKPTYLKDHGHEVLNPALPDDMISMPPSPSPRRNLIEGSQMSWWGVQGAEPWR